MQPFIRMLPNNIYFILLFLAALVCFQLNFFTLYFFILFTLFIIVAFLKEKQRVFVWMAIAYFFGEFLHLYGNRFLNELHLHAQRVFIVEKLLLLFPIIAILYVSNKFNLKMTSIIKQSVWKNPMTNRHNPSKHKRLITLILFILTFVLFFISIVFHRFSFSFLGHLLLFVAVSSIIEEVLWRGLIMQAMGYITNKWAAIIFSSIAYGCSYLMYGYSITLCTVFALFGLFNGWITHYFRNLFPAILCHFAFLLIMIASRVVPFTLL